LCRHVSDNLHKPTCHLMFVDWPTSYAVEGLEENPRCWAHAVAAAPPVLFPAGTSLGNRLESMARAGALNAIVKRSLNFLFFSELLIQETKNVAFERGNFLPLRDNCCCLLQPLLMQVCCISNRRSSTTTTSSSHTSQQQQQQQGEGGARWASSRTSSSSRHASQEGGTQGQLWRRV